MSERPFLPKETAFFDSSTLKGCQKPVVRRLAVNSRHPPKRGWQPFQISIPAPARERAPEDLARDLILMSVQDDTKSRWIFGRWRGAREAHIRSDLQRASNEASGQKDKRVSIILKVN
jgi:hypothetical protein